jgi:hypothetical protein
MPVLIRTCLGACLALFAMLAPAFAQVKEQEVGFIEAYAPEGAALTLRRGDQIVPLRLCARVLQGDRILLVRPDERVVLRLMDRPEPVVITAARGEYVVKAETPARGLLDGAWDSILDALNLLDTPERTRVSASIRSGGGELKVPLLASPQTLIAGKRTLTLGWLPERLGVTVTIRPAKGAPLVSEAKGTGGVWTSAPLDLAPGDYTVEITPRGGKALDASLHVVAPDKVPAIPAELTREALPPAMRALGAATFLAMKGPEWRLEAFQRVKPFTRDFAPADKLFWTLAEGGLK